MVTVRILKTEYLLYYKEESPLTAVDRNISGQLAADNDESQGAVLLWKANKSYLLMLWLNLLLEEKERERESFAYEMRSLI